MQALESHQKAGGGKAVVFSQFTGMLNLVEAGLKCELFAVAVCDRVLLLQLS